MDEQYHFAGLSSLCLLWTPKAYWYRKSAASLSNKRYYSTNSESVEGRALLAGVLLKLGLLEVRDRSGNVRGSR